MGNSTDIRRCFYFFFTAVSGRTPWYGSYSGGTRLTITGRRFSPDPFTLGNDNVGNKVSNLQIKLNLLFSCGHKKYTNNMAGMHISNLQIKLNLLFSCGHKKYTNNMAGMHISYGEIDCFPIIGMKRYFHASFSSFYIQQ